MWHIIVITPIYVLINYSKYYSTVEYFLLYRTEEFYYGKF